MISCRTGGSRRCKAETGNRRQCSAEGKQRACWSDYIKNRISPFFAQFCGLVPVVSRLISRKYEKSPEKPVNGYFGENWGLAKTAKIG